jgi:hypothetical protein
MLNAGQVAFAVPIKLRLPGASGLLVSRRWTAAGSFLWPALVAAAFTVSQLVFVAPHLGLSWDEVVYVSQLSGHAPAAYFDPARARGVSLLAAPVTMLTSSVLVLRIYLSVLSGVGLFLALLAWRGLRPAWQLAVAGAFFGSLWTAQYYGPQVMPDEWVAFSALAATGLFMQAVSADGPVAAVRPRRPAMTGLAGCLALAALVRPGDALYLGAVLALAVLVVRRWRKFRLIVAIAAGAAAGAAEWVAEAWLRFGNPLARMHAAGAEQGGFGVHLAIWAELRAVNGPTLCRPCTVGLRYPQISIWWLALPVLVSLGVLAARRAGRLESSLLAAACGAGVAFQYLFLINYAAPRFLLPAYALAAIPVADAAGWLITGLRGRLRLTSVAVLAVCLLGQLAVQNSVLRHQVDEKISYVGDYTRIAADLHRLGIRQPCLVKGEQDIPVAFAAGCASAGSLHSARLHHPSEPVVVLVGPGQRPPAYAAGWTSHALPGVRTSLLRLVAYMPPAGPRSPPDG